MGGLFLRVAIDKGTGNILSPITKDGRFEYLPIPEIRATTQDKLFKIMIGENSRVVSVSEEYFPEKYLYSNPHLDPEFENYTYGDPTGTKRNQLSKLSKGDVLIFYAGMSPYDEKKGKRDEFGYPRLYIMGYFEIEEKFDFKEIEDKEKREKIMARNDLSNNAHVKVYNEIRKIEKDYEEMDLVIVKGNPEKSKLFEKAPPFGNTYDKLMRDLHDIFGYKGSILRSVGHWIGNGKTEKVKNYLQEGIPYLVGENDNLYSYVLKCDTGFAPNVTGGFCTLACCKPRIRSDNYTKTGDWVIGTNRDKKGKKYGKNELIYAMRVSEKLTFDEFYHDSRFECKKPDNDPSGDNIYFYSDSKDLIQDPDSNHHLSQYNKDHDTQTDRVLIGSIFWYFGNNSPKIPKRFRKEFIKSGPGCRKVNDKDKLKNFINWLASNYRIGIHGNPRDQKEDNKSENISCS